MSNLSSKLNNRLRRKNRIRSVVKGSPVRPRLTAYISNTNVSAQLIDDTTGKTLASSTTVGQKSLKGTMTEKAKWVGEDIAKKAKAKKISSVVFDRNGKLYHGRVAALADAARESGLEI
ncbi:MAG TPA: 50S ribosomal protein L18 [Candidatus Saccharimonadales bacterium]